MGAVREARNITKIARNMALYKNYIGKKMANLNENEFEMLRFIAKRESRSFSEVKEHLNVDKGLVTRMSKKLVSLGYITIESDSNDMRKKLMKATKMGLEIKNEVFDYENEFYNACVSVLSDTEKEDFLRLLDKVYLESKRLRKIGFKELKHE